MIRAIRGAWSRRWTLAPLLLLTAVVVGGLVAVLGFAEAADTPQAVAVPLLLLGLVAVPDTGRQLAAERRGEIALARLRGLTGGQLYAVLAVEPLLVLVLGAVVGVGLGEGVALLAGRTWVGSDTTLVGLDALPAVLGVVGVALVAVLAGMAGAMREPLSEQVSIAERPRAASTVALFGSVLLLVAAAVAVYRSVVADATDGDWVVLAGPALVGLAVGQVAVWVLRLLGRLAVPATSSAGMPGFLATRRLARVADAAAPVRLVVAACVVGAVSLTGAQQVGDWADDTARIRAGAPVQVPLDGEVTEAIGISHELDPDGDYLMAAAVVPGEGSVPARRVFLDTVRFDAVLGDYYGSTPASGVTDHLDQLASSEGATFATGDTLDVTVRGVSSRRDGVLNPTVAVRYSDPTGAEQRTALRLTLGLDGQPASATGTVDDCAGGCQVLGLVLGRSRGDDHVPYVVTRLDFAGLDVLDISFKATTPQEFGNPSGPLTVDDGLMVLADKPEQTAVPELSGGPRTPILATTTASWPDGPVLLDSPGGVERAAEVVGTLPALPFVEADGLLADLPLVTSGDLPTVPAAEVYVLAAADTPADLLDRLTAETGTEPVTLATVERDTDEEVGAVRARVYALTALFCLAVAMLVIAASVARLRHAHLREVAALRVVGVDLRVLRRSGRIELGVLALGALAAAVVGGVAAVRLLLAHLHLVSEPLHAVPLEIRVTLVPVLVAAVVAALTIAVVGGRARSIRADHGRPATLREAAR